MLKKKKKMKNSENRPFLFNPFPKHITCLIFWSEVYFDDISPLDMLNLYIETETAICKISIMMLVIPISKVLPYFVIRIDSVFLHKLHTITDCNKKS